MSATGFGLATLGGLALFQSSGHASPSPPVAPAVNAAVAPAPPAAPTPPLEKVPTMRAQFMAEAEKRAVNVQTEADLDRELAALEERARKQGQVTALEVETGLLLIDRLQHALPAGKSIQKRAEFSARLQRLSLTNEP